MTVRWINYIFIFEMNKSLSDRGWTSFTRKVSSGRESKLECMYSTCISWSLTETISVSVDTGMPPSPRSTFYVLWLILPVGTDYTNPFLGGGFGPGNKVAGGFDFVGDAFTGV